MSRWNRARARREEGSRLSPHSEGLEATSAQCTCIEDLPAVGYELPEEHLRMVTGEMGVILTFI